jgi:hypothetical protein
MPQRSKRRAQSAKDSAQTWVNQQQQQHQQHQEGVNNLARLSNNQSLQLPLQDNDAFADFYAEYYPEHTLRT